VVFYGVVFTRRCVCLLGGGVFYYLLGGGGVLWCSGGVTIYTTLLYGGVGVYTRWLLGGVAVCGGVWWRWCVFTTI
jgi:hypothetical protein